MGEHKKILIITYYWPPSGGAGVQRWLKFTKYLPKYGWDPMVFTPENPQFDLKDESLLNEINPDVDVLKFPIWEPYGLFKRLTGTKKLKQGQILEDRSNGLLKKMSIFIRGNLFIPDPRRFWVKPSVNYLNDLIRTNGVKHVITTGPPHSLHLIGLKLKYHNPAITWFADFRDPWTEWDILKKFDLLPFTKKKHRKLEEEVLKVADVTLATGDKAGQDFKRLGARRTAVFTNGFDLVRTTSQEEEKDSLKTTLLHLGMLNENRLPKTFFNLLENALAEGKFELKLKLTGINSALVLAFIKEKKRLSESLEVSSSLPYHELQEEYNSADILLLLQTNSKESNSQLPGKLFEYLAQKKPILAFGDPTSDVAHILKETGSGMMIDYNDEEEIRAVVDQILQGNFGVDFKYEGIEKYSREEITKSLVALLNEFDHAQ